MIPMKNILINKSSRKKILSPANKGRVLMISAGMLSPKKINHFSKMNLYLNYGLLGLATILNRAGYDPIVIHGNFINPIQFVDDLDRAGHLESALPILISIPSSYALDWTRVVCRLIKQMNPDALIVVGGRWVIGDDGAWIRRQIPDIDLVVFGTAEHSIENTLNTVMWDQLVSTPPNTLSTLDYSLLDGFADFTPSFEVSRGCGRGCGFCAEGDVPLSTMKNARVLADEIEACFTVYQENDIRAYFEASLFQPSSEWIADIYKEFATHNLDFQWRAESRVDAFSSHQVEQLAKAGLKVLDLGLESASPQQLLNMRKTTTPAIYLRRASELLKACHDNGIWTKVNVLLYPGETKESISETEEWLDHHRQYIKGISAGPMVIYRYGNSSQVFLKEIEFYGARAVSSSDLETKGFADIHLSKELSNQDAIFEANRLSSNFMSTRDYYDLKTFSYFPRDMTFEKFSE